MDFNIAHWHISVHRASRTTHRAQRSRALEIPIASPVERRARQEVHFRQYDQQREQTYNWFLLHGGH